MFRAPILTFAVADIDVVRRFCVVDPKEIANVPALNVTNTGPGEFYVIVVPAVSNSP